MISSDLDEVNALANEIHVNYPEDDRVFREKFALFPYGCFTLEASNSVIGYCISHPWTKGMPPALNAMMGGLPPSPSTYFLHDVAVSPSYRGRGLVQFLVGLLPIVARLFRLDHMTLISVNRTELFWRKFGFKDTSAQTAVLAATIQYIRDLYPPQPDRFYIAIGSTQDGRRILQRLGFDKVISATIARRGAPVFQLRSENITAHSRIAADPNRVIQVRVEGLQHKRTVRSARLKYT
jgi:hypothetical protein